MKAKVKFINHTIGRVAALTEDGDYSTFEPLGGEVEIGDIYFTRPVIVKTLLSENLASSMISILQRAF